MEGKLDEARQRPASFPVDVSQSLESGRLRSTRSESSQQLRDFWQKATASASLRSFAAPMQLKTIFCLIHTPQSWAMLVLETSMPEPAGIRCRRLRFRPVATRGSLMQLGFHSVGAFVLRSLQQSPLFQHQGKVANKTM